MLYDVAVVGAGLAGLQCARLLGDRGLRVVLLDRKKSPGAPVHTTGIFVRKTWEDFPLPEAYFGRAIRRVVLYSPARRAFEVEAPRAEFRIGRMLPLYLDLLGRCERAGVAWRHQARVRGCGVGCVAIADAGNIRARFIIGADGARSTVARHLGLDRNHELLLGLEDVVEAISPEPSLHCVVDPRLAPGYIAWVANDGEEAHVGVAGYRNGWDPARALDAFRRTAPIPFGRTIERRGGWIPVNGILGNIANRGGLLVGDAAGAVSPLTAGGLDGALRLSSFAAEVAAAYLEHEDEAVLHEYSGKRFRAHLTSRLWMRRIMRALETPALAEVTFAVLGTPPFRTLAGHVFFARRSFPDVPDAAVGSAAAFRGSVSRPPDARG